MIAANPFATLGVEPRFDLDLKAIEQRHRTLSGSLHPDRFVGKPATERRLALDRAIAVNAAWRALRDPVKRAESLFQHHGIDVGELKEPQAPPALLMEMMEVREHLAAAKQERDLDALEKLGKQMRAREAEVIATLSKQFSASAGDLELLRQLLPSLGELRYLRRFFEELDAIEEQLID